MKRTLLLGTALIDHLIYSEKPLKEDSCNKVNNSLCPGGSMRNIAYNLGHLGRPIDFLSCWGNDLFAENIQEELSGLGIKTYGPKRDLPTPIFTSINTPDNHLLISSLTADFVIDKNYDFPYANYDLLICDIDDKELLDKIVSYKNNIRIITLGFLPTDDLKENLEGSVLNRREFFDFFSHENHNFAFADLTSWLVVTLDQDGLFYSYQGEHAYLRNKKKTKTGYPVGCGDALVAGLVYQLDLGNDFLTSLSFAHDLAETAFRQPANVI